MSEPLTLDPASVDAIAERVADLLRGSPTTPDLIDATEVARRLGLSRATVYERADELGAIRISDGPRSRLRFDPTRVAEAIDTDPKPHPTPAPRSAPPSRRRRASTDLLPIHNKENRP